MVWHSATRKWHNNAVFKAGVWFLFSIILGEGVPFLVVLGLAHFENADTEKVILSYLGHSAPQGIAFGILMAVCGDRIIEHWNISGVFNGTVFLVAVFALFGLAIVLDEHYLKNNHPTLKDVGLRALPAVLVLIYATHMKHHDLRKAMSSSRIRKKASTVSASNWIGLMIA